ncbi:alpha/beta hydrolase [Convivina praedatoris]|uniref:Alpha/beta hydrolase n=1 Tax=Convivina praedatoris TaxID=2880963 RepID=A0ABM9D249_9LACO|nr:alpha/beta hydrolase [Convivina sp. LMG 32447]CAH1853668.1 hypothetical protein R077815_00902 [Convivina sp. LMG 32447]CAH1855127.1 hypothetical protein LMG032447_01016 [Convivina sp. LMG 32447]
MTKTTHWWRYCLLVLGLTIIGVSVLIYFYHPKNQVKELTTIPANTVPTFYLHGYGGTYNSTKNMVAAAQKQSGVKRVLIARVNKNGEVKFEGDWPAGVKRPVIQVIYEDNRNSDFHYNAAGFHQVITSLQERYHCKKFNVVAHSMGNLTLMYYLADYGQQQQLPQLDKYVAIAGHFDGIRAMDDPANSNQLAADGRPELIKSYYQYLLDHRQNFDMSTVDVLNIYGDLEDGSHSDGSVTNVSSQSLKYLLGNQVHSYRELLIKGKQAQHSQLHENSTVDRAVIKFLWD